MAKSMMIALLAGLLAIGCGDDSASTDDTGMDGGMIDIGDGSGGIPASCTDDGRCVFVLDALTLPTAAGTSIAGFDLDGNSDIVCMNEDFDDGVDNTFSSIAPLLGAFGRMVPINDLLSESLLNGDALLLLELNGVGSDAPTVSLYAGNVPEGGVMVDGEGRVTPGQTFTGSLSGMAPATVGESTVAAEGLAGFEMRVQIADPEEAGSSLIAIEDAPISFSFAADGTITGGVLGGSIDLEGLIALVLGLPGFDENSPGLAILGNFADLDPDPESGECGALSLGITFTAVEAELAGPSDAGI